MSKTTDTTQNHSLIELWEQSLSIASEHNDVKMVDFILNQAENIDVGKAVQAVAMNNSQKVIERLLEYGFNPNSRLMVIHFLKQLVFMIIYRL